MRRRRFGRALSLLFAACTTLPPVLDAPKEASTAVARSEATFLGKRVAARERQHPGLSGFRLLIDGTESFALHLEIADRAERTLDVQYFQLQQDDTGKAAARGDTAGGGSRRSRKASARRRGSV